MTQGEAQIIEGDVLAVLATLPAESVSCVVTSPPYWSLRKYDAPEVIWGGDPDCPHTLDAEPMQGEGYAGSQRWQHEGVSRQETPDAWVKESYQRRSNDGGDPDRKQPTNPGSIGRDDSIEHATCSRCGAWRGQYGLEPTPELYVEHTLMVLRALRRVLRDDGVVWWNIGDGYASNPAKGSRGDGKEASWLAGSEMDGLQPRPWGAGLKPKDLVLMPFRVALVAQADGWWVRSVVVWAKPNAMPESVRDRPTDAHEYILMLTKNARYWYDQEAVREPITESTKERARYGWDGHMEFEPDGTEIRSQPDPVEQMGERWAPPAGRNLRSVWTFPTAQTPEAHFATFPEELPRRCIEASCPREICAKCGTARVRLIERTSIGKSYAVGKSAAKRNDGLTTAFSGYDDGSSAPIFETLGWTSCACEEPDYQPGLVFDPFVGIGTTGLVARRLGRRFVGIELSPKYAELAREKMRVWWRTARLVAPAPQEPQARMPLEE